MLKTSWQAQYLKQGAELKNTLQKSHRQAFVADQKKEDKTPNLNEFKIEIEWLRNILEDLKKPKGTDLMKTKLLISMNSRLK